MTLSHSLPIFHKIVLLDQGVGSLHIPLLSFTLRHCGRRRTWLHRYLGFYLYLCYITNFLSDSYVFVFLSCLLDQSYFKFRKGNFLIPSMLYNAQNITLSLVKCTLYNIMDTPRCTRHSPCSLLSVPLQISCTRLWDRNLNHVGNYKTTEE